MNIEDNAPWEQVTSSRHQITSRIKVPGGWLYEVIRSKTGMIGMQFVPEAVKETRNQYDDGFNTALGLVLNEVKDLPAAIREQCEKSIIDRVINQKGPEAFKFPDETITKHKAPEDG